MPKPTVIVTGHGRSGTHWLAQVLGHFVDARHEPSELGGAVTVDCRLAQRMPRLADEYRVVHLVRDGREVVRSAYEFYGGTQPFRDICAGWAQSVDACRDVEAVRLEDLLLPNANTAKFRLTHWTEWPADLSKIFWDTCGEQMRRHGYGETS